MLKARVGLLQFVRGFLLTINIYTTYVCLYNISYLKVKIDVDRAHQAKPLPTSKVKDSSEIKVSHQF